MAVLSVEEALRLCVRALCASGMDPVRAKIVADILVEAEMAGRATHGLIRLPGIAGQAEKEAGAEIRTVREDESTALLDAGGGLGYLAAYDAMGLALGKAAARGLSLVGVRNSGHSGMLAYYARLALERDYIGVALCNTRPMVAAHGGIEAVFGTNPLAVAIPAERIPLVLDMSTSRVTYGDLLVAGKLGRKIQPGSALDAEGRITEDPDEAREGALLPFGEHKGYGLGLVIQILAGALVDGEILKTGGLLFLAIDPGIFIPVDRFKRQVTEYLDFVKRSRRMKGVAEILIPGERGERSRELCREQGIQIDDELLEQLRDLSDAAGMA